METVGRGGGNGTWEGGEGKVMTHLLTDAFNQTQGNRSIRHRAIDDPVKVPIHYRTQSYDAISCYGISVERTDENAYRV